MSKAKNDLLELISRQIELLESEIEAINKQRKADKKNKSMAYFLVSSLKRFLHDEVSIKSAKIRFLQGMKNCVDNNDEQLFFDLNFAYAHNRFSQVFVGINNRTEQLIEKIAVYFIDAKKEKNSYELDEYPFKKQQP